MVNDKLEEALAELDADPPSPQRWAAQSALLQVYGDWLEGQGWAHASHALRAHRPDPFQPVDLSVVSDLAEPPLGTRYQAMFQDITLPLELFVVDEIQARGDNRPIEERKEISLTADNLNRVMYEQSNAFTLDLKAAGIGDSTIAIRCPRLTHFEVEAVAQNLVNLGVAAENLDGALRLFFGNERVRAVERAWRSLRWLCRRLDAPVRLCVLNASAADLLADFEDAQELRKSGPFRAINNHNHPGMRPSGAIVLGSNVRLPLSQHRYLLRCMGEVARMKGLPFVAGLDRDPCKEDWPSFETSLGRHVILARPSFVLRPAHSFEDAPLEGSASYLIAARMAAAFSKHWGGGGLQGSLQDVKLASPTSRSRAILAASRGCSEFVAVRESAYLFAGATAGSSLAGSRSLDLHVIASRLALQLQNIHYRRYRAAEALPAAFDDLGRMVGLLEEALRSRLRGSPNFGVSLANPTFEEVPTDLYSGALAVDLDLTLPSSDGGAPARYVERMTVRLSF